MVYHSGLQRALLVVTGGYDPTVTNIQIWSWDGAAWTLLSDDGPSARSYPGLAYDSDRDRVVLFGGAVAPGGVTGPPELWEWDRAAWTPRAVAGPSGRTGPGMAYDAARHRTVLFGGYIYTQTSWTYLGDTWEWDGQTWSRIATTGPAPRAVPCFAYDSIRARTVLVGGDVFWPTDLWEWDGAAWLQRSTPPPIGTPSWMAFDPQRARMIVGADSRRQTWELDTAAAVWTLRDPGAAPLGPAAFDVARSRAVVLSGGSAPATLEYDGTATIVPPSVIQQPDGLNSTCTPVSFTVQAGGTAVTYRWRRDGQPLTDGGNISGATTDRLSINPVSPPDAGSYDVVLSNVCATVASAPAVLVVAQACYANCDQSTTPPILNVNDFVCFLNHFAAGDSYANCTGDCNPPPCLNVNDFVCFQSAFAAGCCTGP